MGLEDTMDQMLWMGEQVVTVGRVAKPDTLLAHIAKVTERDIRRVARELQAGQARAVREGVGGGEQDAGEDEGERDALLQEVEQWRKDWASLDTGAYLRHYSRDFSSDSADYAAWAKQKQLVNSAKTWIKVDLSNVSVFTYPEQPNMVVVNFEQDYNSSNLSNRMKKRQYWIKHNNRWQIVYEGAA